MSVLCIVILLLASGIAGGAIVSPKFRQEILNYREEVSAAFFGQDAFPYIEDVREAAKAYSQRNATSV